MKTSKRSRSSSRRQGHAVTIVLAGTALLCWLIEVIRRRSSRTRPHPWRVEQRVVIERSLEEVFAMAGDPLNDARWSSAIEEVRKTSEGSTGAESTFVLVGRALGRRFEFSFELYEYEPNHKVVLKPISSGALQITGVRIFEAVPGGTRFTLAQEGQTGGFFWLLPDRVMLFVGKRVLQGYLANLKEILEAGSGSTVTAGQPSTGGALLEQAARSRRHWPKLLEDNRSLNYNQNNSEWF